MGDQVLIPDERRWHRRMPAPAFEETDMSAPIDTQLSPDRAPIWSAPHRCGPYPPGIAEAGTLAAVQGYGVFVWLIVVCGLTKAWRLRCAI
jgi:hypothetical protein